jgi:hypothetical protein
MGSRLHNMLLRHNLVLADALVHCQQLCLPHLQSVLMRLA